MMIGPLPSPCFLPFLSEPAKFPCLSGRALCPRLSCPLPPREAAGAIQNRRGLVFLAGPRSEEHTSELPSLMRISYAVFCLKKQKITHTLQSTYLNIRNNS